LLFECNITLLHFYLVKKEVQVRQKLFLKKERWMPLRQQILSSAV